MRNLLLLSMLSGLLLTHWPMIMNRSGLSSIMSVTLFAFFCFCGLGAVAVFSDKSSLYTANIGYAICAGLVGSAGLAVFGYVISHASPAEMSKYMIPFLLIQIVPPAVYNVVQTGHLDRNKIIGLTAAAVSIYFVNNSK